MVVAPRRRECILSFFQTPLRWLMDELDDLRRVWPAALLVALMFTALGLMAVEAMPPSPQERAAKQQGGNFQVGITDGHTVHEDWREIMADELNDELALQEQMEQQGATQIGAALYVEAD